MTRVRKARDRRGRKALLYDLSGKSFWEIVLGEIVLSGITTKHLGSFALLGEGWGILGRAGGWGGLFSAAAVKPAPSRAESSLRTPGGEGRWETGEKGWGGRARCRRSRGFMLPPQSNWGRGGMRPGRSRHCWGRLGGWETAAILGGLATGTVTPLVGLTVWGSRRRLRGRGREGAGRWGLAAPRGRPCRRGI